MELKIKIFSGPNRTEPTKTDIDKNISAVERAISGKMLINDYKLLDSTKSILVAIRNQLPG